ncbi:MAG: elongator complex protein 3, partial [Desulfobulbales bacterium]
ARGHTAKQSEAALRLLKEKGFTVGAQIMCGLPSDTTNKLMTTARKVAALAPDFVRIYPVLVIKGSGLEKMYRDTRYQPLSLPKAIALAARVKTIFDQHDIRVVRMGLQPSEELAAQVVSGPYHPSFGELVIARNLFKKSREALRRTGLDGPKRLVVATLDESAFRGPHNVNMKRLAALNLLKNTEVVFIADQPRNSVQVHGLF